MSGHYHNAATCEPFVCERMDVRLTLLDDVCGCSNSRPGPLLRPCVFSVVEHLKRLSRARQREPFSFQQTEALLVSVLVVGACASVRSMGVRARPGTVGARDGISGDDSRSFACGSTEVGTVQLQ